MKLNVLKGAAIVHALYLIAATTPVAAHENDATAPHALDHAPIGVMGDHRHKKGEWMLSYRYMNMEMDGSSNGTNSLSPETIATTVPNRFFGMPGQPPTLRVVPTRMTMEMHMVGAMYGLTDRITLAGMTSYIRKEMDHTTFQGGTGTNVLGEFTTEAEGIGDTMLTAIIGIDDGSNPRRQMNVNLGMSLPTGSNEETGQILTPTGATPLPRLPYPMQLGTGTFDFLPAVTYFDRQGKIGWGGQVKARLPLGNNEEGYKFGERLEATAWLAYEPAYWISFSGRLKGMSQGTVRGIDPAIIAPVQTADPDNQGGDTVEAAFGVNLVGQTGVIKGHRLALELALPFYRNLNGPQLETDSTLTIGWQKAF